MITAKEARKKANALNVERIKKEREAVEKEINRSVEAGNTFCWIDSYTTSQDTEDWLKSLGYIVEDEDEGNIKVSW